MADVEDPDLTDEQQAQVAEEWAALPKAIYDRRRKVQHFYGASMTYQMMADVFKCSVQTIKNDVKWLRNLAAGYLERFVSAEEVGQSVELYDDIERKALDMMDEVIEKPSVTKKKTWTKGGLRAGSSQTVEETTHQVDHTSIQGYMRTALTARYQKHNLLIKMGMLKVVPKKIDIEGLDIANLNDPDKIAAAESRIADQIAATEEKLARLALPDPLKTVNPQEWEN